MFMFCIMLFGREKVINSMETQNKLSPQDLRRILKADNMEIVELCKRAFVIPNKDENGHIYFTQDELSLLKQAKEPAKSLVPKKTSQLVVDSLLGTLKRMEDDMTSSITESLTKVLDERLEGMDEVVVELIRCKTENENLKNKVNELNKENYKLKNMLNSYKPFAFGMYVKKEEKDILL